MEVPIVELAVMASLAFLIGWTVPYFRNEKRL